MRARGKGVGSSPIVQIGQGPPSRRLDLFGGTGEVLVWDLLRGKGAAPFEAVLSCQLAPGGRVGRHHQDQFAEIVIGLTAHGEARVDGEVQPFGPGAVVHVPLGASLELVNESTTTQMAYLIVKARG